MGGFLLGAVVLVACVRPLAWAPVRLGRRLAPHRRTIAMAAPAMLVVLFAAACGDNHRSQGQRSQGHRSLGQRYHSQPAASLGGEQRGAGLEHALAWAQHVHRARIGFVGTDLPRADLSATVTPVGIRTGNRGLRLPRSCAEWRQTVTRGRYAYLLIAPAGTSSGPPPELDWLAGDTSVTVVLRAGGGVTVLAIHGPLHPQTCVKQSAEEFGH